MVPDCLSYGNDLHSTINWKSVMPYYLAGINAVDAYLKIHTPRENVMFPSPAPLPDQLFGSDFLGAGGPRGSSRPSAAPKNAQVGAYLVV